MVVSAMSKVAVSVMGVVVLVAGRDGGGGFGGDGDGGASTGQGSDGGLDVGEVAGVGEVAEVGEAADVGEVDVEEAAEVGVSNVETKWYRSLVKVRCDKCQVTFQGPSLALGQLQATIPYHRAQLNSVKSPSLEEPTEGPQLTSVRGLR